MTTADGDHSLISFDIDGNVVRARDELEEQELRLTVAGTPSAEPALTDLFVFPVDDAIAFTTTELHVGPHSDTFLRSESGECLDEFTEDRREFPEATYFLEITGGVKAYVRIPDASFSAVYPHRETTSAPLRLTLDEPTRLVFGVRSLHSRPQATITVPDDPAALREALPYLGSSIKEFSCERSWPSLRGYPPALEVGEELAIPDELSKPETGVTIAVPETFADLYRVAPLAFYLGSEVVPGDEPELRLANGYVESLRTATRSLEETVDYLLRSSLVLDSLTRMGGYYTCQRYEYEEICPELPFYPPNLYDASLSAQLVEYLEVSPSVLEPYLPRVPTTAVLRPRPEDVPLLPGLLDTLSRIRVGDPIEHRRTDDSSLVTGYSSGTPPPGTARLLDDSFDNALSRSRSTADDARFVFVADRDRAARLRATLSDLGERTRSGPTDAPVVAAPTVEELRRLLEEDTDFLHCDLPVSSDGFDCDDGILDPASIPRVGANAFAIRGTESLEAGLELIRRGAIAGITADRTVSPIRLRQLVDTFLKGHSIAESTDLAEVAAPYRFVGDASRAVVRRNGMLNPVRIDIESVTTDEHEVVGRFQPTDVYRLGGISRIVDSPFRDSYQLNGVTARERVRYTTSEVVTLLESDELVVRLNGWTYDGETEASEALVRESARQALTDRP